ncbi:HAMP domain-containing sensor histidine kinase [Sphingomonas sp. ASV193]|uniref:sensor histidine kinase n=1 Tax=Sphingomonas sp. ASV193 TaxID=3144405 RepID=UPI0032E89FC1
MASAAPDAPVTGRVDRDGRLVSADPSLEQLQAAAGSALGHPLAVPQLAALARSAQTLVVPLSRAVLAADDGHDLDLWVKAEPDAEGVTLVIERWSARPAAAARLALGAMPDEQEADAGAAPDPLTWATDARLHLTDMSPRLAEWLGADEDPVGKPLTRLFRLLEEDDGAMPLLSALAAQADLNGQRATARHGADTREMLLTAQPLHDEQGRFVGFDGRVSGIELAPGPATGAAIEAGLDETLDRALRTPLDRIIASADHIVERADGPLRSDYASYAGDIASAARHLLSVIGTMNDAPEGFDQRVDIAAIAAEAVGLVESSALARQVEIEIDRPELRHLVSGEPRAIVQILVNILGNAIRHSPPGGTVAMVFEKAGGTIEVTVADQGPGIDRADQQRLFERYERLGQTDGGAGLGLVISRRLARSMGGDIRLESAKGEGARFTLVLPLARD